MVRDPLPVVLWSEIDRMVGAEGVNCLTLALPIDRQLRSIEGGEIMQDLLDALIVDDRVVKLSDSDDLGWLVVGSHWVVAGW